MNTQLSQGLKSTFLIHFIVALLFGLGFLLIPVAVGNVYGLNVQEPDIYRLLGAAMLGFAVSSWLAYKETNWESCGCHGVGLDGPWYAGNAVCSAYRRVPGAWMA